MAEEMSIETYLASGGVLSSPANVPSRYRAELMKIMATFVDSELAGAAGFADVINQGPGIKERISAAKIVLEKTSNAEEILKLMGEFGANTDIYANHHPWAERLPRDTAPGSKRSAHDMRLSVFNYPLDGWTDAVVMNLCMGSAVSVQLKDLSQVSYQPLAEALRRVIPIEQHHAELAQEGVANLVSQGKASEVAASLAYWTPRIAAVFGSADEARLETLRSWRLRKSSGPELKRQWQGALDEALAKAGYTA